MAQWRREKVLQWGGGLQNSKNERGQRPEDVEAMGGLNGVVGQRDMTGVSYLLAYSQVNETTPECGMGLESVQMAEVLVVMASVSTSLPSCI
jgi:hypothetical protein